MNRRSLFKLLAGAACAAAIELTGLRPAVPKAAQYVINPEYVNAAYEDLFVYSRDAGPAFKLLVQRGAKEKTDNPIHLASSLPNTGVLIGSEESVFAVEGDFQRVIEPNLPRYEFKDGAYHVLPKYILQS